MSANPIKKIKINLLDYPYQRDIESRLIMAELSIFEVDVLTEIVHGSLKTKLTQLAEYLEIELSQLLPTLDKLKKTELYRIEKDLIIVDKEKRKYWETQIPKFNDNFRADMGFLRDLLSKVPIHILPVWYSLPRTSDDIFHSIVEKYLLTPRIYKRYLNDLTFDEPILNEIMNDVLNAPGYKIHAKALIKKYALSREQFEEFMLQLEFNLVCFLSYNQIEDKWVEVITPFYEWSQYLTFQSNSSPTSLEDKTKICRTHPNDFGFVHDISLLIKHVMKTPIEVTPSSKGLAISKELQNELFSHLSEETLSNQYVSTIIRLALQLQLVESHDHQLHSCMLAAEWLKKHVQEQAIALYRSITSQSCETPGSYIDRNLRETEKCLKKICDEGWIYFRDFAKFCTAPLGENEPVMLKQMGKRWKYHIPEYSEDDIATLEQYIFGTLFYSGILATGNHEGKRCFCVTPFGRMTLV